MGQYNSSVTRVWPVFDYLFRKDQTGGSWLTKLVALGGADAAARFGNLGDLDVALARFERAVPPPLIRAIGGKAARKLATIRNAFEVDIPPSSAFLRWLIENPSRLTWPMVGRSALTYGAETQRWRKALVEGDGAARRQALNELEAVGVKESRRRWWAFEGFTSVDCYLETASLVLLVEGKRTEPISAATSWYPERNQIVRNLEVARALAGGRKNYAVLLCSETPTTLPEGCWQASLPHLSAAERTELQEHYIGCACWPDIAEALCDGLRLPSTVPEAVDTCLALRVSGN